MISVDLTKQIKAENYKLLTGSIVPRPIAFVTSLSETGIINAAPFSYFNLVSSNPPLVSVSVERSVNGSKHTAHNINQQKEFVIHVVDQNNVEKVNRTAASLPATESEIDFVQLTTVSSEKITVPGIKEARIRFECVLKQSIDLSDQNNGCDLMIGEIVQMHIAQSVYAGGKIDIDALKPVSRLAGSNYAMIGDTFTLKRPK